jgi:HTH-type transcriptional regulator/antitoxin HigA
MTARHAGCERVCPLQLMETSMFSPADLEELAAHFVAVTAKVPLRPITNEAEYDEAVRVLNALLNAGASDETHELAPLVDTLGDFIGDYDDANYVLPDVSPAEVIRELMAQHELKQSDLPELGSQGVVSEILNGKRDLNKRQIEVLSRRFNVSPAVFFKNV